MYAGTQQGHPLIYRTSFFEPWHPRCCASMQCISFSFACYWSLQHEYLCSGVSDTISEMSCPGPCIHYLHYVHYGKTDLIGRRGFSPRYASGSASLLNRLRNSPLSTGYSSTITTGGEMAVLAPDPGVRPRLPRCVQTHLYRLNQLKEDSSPAPHIVLSITQPTGSA